MNLANFLPEPRVIPPKHENKIKLLTKLEDGGIRLEFNSGKVTTIPASESTIQAFCIYTMLADL